MNQESFSRLFADRGATQYATDALARAARDARARELRRGGRAVRSWTLPNQIRPYSGFGQPDGGICNVYMINVS